MKLVGEQSELVASQEQGAGTWAGKGQGSPGSPGWQPGTPCLGGAGGASLSTGYRGSQDIELSRDAHFIYG